MINGLAINILKDGQPMFEPYRIFQESGIKIGVIGIATPQTAETADPRDLSGVTFLDGEPTEKFMYETELLPNQPISTLPYSIVTVHTAIISYPRLMQASKLFSKHRMQ